MPIAAKLGKGSVVRIGRGASPTYTTLVGLLDVTFPDQAATELDRTTQDSPGRYEESMAGMIPAATLPMTGFYVEGSATDILLLDLFQTGEDFELEITAPEGDPRTWDAYVKKYTPTMPVKGNMTFAVEFVCSAEVTA